MLRSLPYLLITCLQVHAVDEVIWLLCGEGSSFLQLVTNKSETTADHEQQESSDDQTKCKRKDRTWRRNKAGTQSKIYASVTPTEHAHYFIHDCLLKSLQQPEWFQMKWGTSTSTWDVRIDTNVTWLWDRMPSHCWKWFGDGAVTLHLALGDFRSSFNKNTKTAQFRNHSPVSEAPPPQLLKIYLPISVCLVTAGATVAGLKTGPEDVSYINKNTLIINTKLITIGLN